VAGDIETVSTVSILVPLKLVPFDKLLELLSKTPLPMVFFLIGDVLRHLPNAGMGNRKGTITAPPGKLAVHQIALVYLMGSTTLE